MSDLKPGDLVNVTIKGARVHGLSSEGWLSFWITDRATMHTLDTSPPGVTVERVAPAEWPPQPGDLWRDGHGSLWFALGRRVLMVPGDPVGDLGGYEPDKVLAKVGPLTLVRREEAK